NLVFCLLQKDFCVGDSFFTPMSRGGINKACSLRQFRGDTLVLEHFVFLTLEEITHKDWTLRCLGLVQRDDIVAVALLPKLNGRLPDFNDTRSGQFVYDTY